MVEVQTDELYGGESKRKAREFKFIKWEMHDGLGRLTLNRPPHNYLDGEMLTEIAIAIETLHDLPDSKAILLRAAKESKSFCGGVVIPEYTNQRVFQMLDAFARVYSSSLEVSKPLVVVVEGPAHGGGCELAAFGDMVIGTPKAEFSQPEIKKLGMFPPFATSIFPHIIGPKRAMEMLLTGEPLQAEEALNLGLMSRLVPEGEIDAVVENLMNQIVQNSAPVLALAKRTIYEGMGMSLLNSLKHSQDVFLNELCKLEDSQEGLRALAEKRRPQWKNR